MYIHIGTIYLRVYIYIHNLPPCELIIQSRNGGIYLGTLTAAAAAVKRPFGPFTVKGEVEVGRGGEGMVERERSYPSAGEKNRRRCSRAGALPSNRERGNPPPAVDNVYKCIPRIPIRLLLPPTPCSPNRELDDREWCAGVKGLGVEKKEENGRGTPREGCAERYSFAVVLLSSLRGRRFFFPGGVGVGKIKGSD